MPRRLAPLLLLAPLAAATMPVDEGVATLAPDAETHWVPFELTPGNQMRFTLTVDGRPLSAILDTGVSHSVLARRVADPARVRSVGSAAAVGGAVPVGWMPLRAITLGALTRTGGGVAVAELPATATGDAAPVDMLVGRDLTGTQALDIDYAHRRFRLLPPGRLPFDGAAVPLAVSPRRQVYESAVTLGERRIAPMVVDTGDGAALTLSGPAFADAAPAGLPSTTTVSYGIAGAVVSRLAILPEVRLGDAAARDVEVRVEPDAGFSQGIGVAGRIGSGLLQRYRVLLDPVAGRMVLGPATDAAQQTPRSTSGLLLAADPARLRVVHVMRGSPAAAQGWRDGEAICAVDGAPIRAGYVAAWAAGAPGTRVALTICDGPVRTLTLARFY